MTIIRTPGTTEFALHATLGLLRCDIHAATGRSVNYFEKLSNPNSRSKLSFADAMLFDSLLLIEGHQPLFKLLAEENAEKIECCPDMHEAVASLHAEVGSMSKIYYAMLRAQAAGRSAKGKLGEMAHKISRQAMRLREAVKA